MPSNDQYREFGLWNVISGLLLDHGEPEVIPSPAGPSVTYLKKRRGKATSFPNGKLELGRSAEAFVNQQNWQELQTRTGR
jgi:hypothetical protein